MISKIFIFFKSQKLNQLHLFEFISSEIIKRILVPWNLDRNHWTLFIFDSNRKVIEYFDSYGKDPYSFELKLIIREFRVRLHVIYCKFIMSIEYQPFKFVQRRCLAFGDIDSWQNDYNPSRIQSSQSNSFDCGMHTAKVMQKLFVNPLATIRHIQADFPGYRNQLCLEILDYHDANEELQFSMN